MADVESDNSPPPVTTTPLSTLELPKAQFNYGSAMSINTEEEDGPVSDEHSNRASSDDVHVRSEEEIATHNAACDVAFNLPIAKMGILFKKNDLNGIKKKASNRAWKQYYAVLRGHILFFYKDENEARLNKLPEDDGTISIKSSISDIAYDYQKRKFVFRLKTFNGSEYLLQAHDHEDMINWIKQIQRCNNPDEDIEGEMELIRRKASQFKLSNGHLSKNNSPTNTLGGHGAVSSPSLLLSHHNNHSGDHHEDSHAQSASGNENEAVNNVESNSDQNSSSSSSGGVGISNSHQLNYKGSFLKKTDSIKIDRKIEKEREKNEKKEEKERERLEKEREKEKERLEKEKEKTEKEKKRAESKLQHKESLDKEKKGVSNLTKKDSKSPADGTLSRNFRQKMGKMFSRKNTLDDLQAGEHQVGYPTFGVSLEDHLEFQERFIPPIVELCINFIEEHALTAVGIYRLSGNSTAVQLLKEAFERDPFAVNLSDERWDDVHAISGVLKLYLRELPEALVTNALYGKFIQASKIYDYNERLYTIKDLIHELPKVNFETLKRIICHLHKISEKSDENKMMTNNLAIVFGPTLFRPAEEDALSMINDMSYQCSLVEALITQHDWLFAEYVDEATDNSETSSSAAVASEETLDKNVEILLSREHLDKIMEANESQLEENAESDDTTLEVHTQDQDICQQQELQDQEKGVADGEQAAVAEDSAATINPGQSAQHDDDDEQLDTVELTEPSTENGEEKPPQQLVESGQEASDPNPPASVEPQLEISSSNEQGSAACEESTENPEIVNASDLSFVERFLHSPEAIL